MCLVGFDASRVEESRQQVLDEDYQTELPDFTDAEPTSPLDFLKDFQEDDCPDGEDCGEGGATDGGDGDGGGEAGESKTGDKRPGSKASGNKRGSSAGDDGGGNTGKGTTGGPDGESGKAAEGAGSDSGRKGFWEHEAQPEDLEPPEPPDFEIPESLATVLQILAISVGAIILVLVAIRIFKAVSDRTDEASVGTDEDLQSGSTALRQDAPTRPHEELALESSYNEAIHRLLLEAIEQLSKHQPSLSSPSLTARELLDRVRLDDESLLALTRLVRAVEEILFAQRDADEQKYQNCLEHFRVLQRAIGPAPGGSK